MGYGEMNLGELSNKLLVAKDDREHMLLHYASLARIIQILVRLWNWAKEQLTVVK